jgi:hypothetical protein
MDPIRSYPLQDKITAQRSVYCQIEANDGWEGPDKTQAVHGGVEVRPESQKWWLGQSMNE